MLSSPILQRQAAARVASGPPDLHGAAAVQVVGHAGLAIQSDGGAPGRHHLDEALALGVDRLEVDVCCTADGRLVMRHDTSIGGSGLVADLDLAALRLLDPAVLTLDEAAEHLAGRVPMLLDIKVARAAELLGNWLRRRRDLESLAACTENLPWLLHLRFSAPRLARWPSFPNVGDRRTHHVQRVVAGLWRSHASVGGLRRGVADVRRAAGQFRHRPHESLGRLAGLPWREQLRTDLHHTCDGLAAAGVCLHHWVVSDELVEDAHPFGLHVNAWTVNNPFAARVVATAGVDSITTDRVDLVRHALRPDPPPDPSIRAGRQLTVVANSSRN